MSFSALASIESNSSKDKGSEADLLDAASEPKQDGVGQGPPKKKAKAKGDERTTPDNGPAIKSEPNKEMLPF